jgi:PTS system ascorbate-specific IIA component
MLMRAIAYRAEPLESAMQKAMHGGQQGIIPIGHLGSVGENQKAETKES